MLGLKVAAWFQERRWAWIALWVLIIPVMGYLYFGDWLLQQRMQVSILDLQFAFTAERAAAILNKLSAAQRESWVWGLLIDYFYAALYALLLTAWLYKTARPFNWQGRWWFHLTLTAPLVAGALDMLENAAHLYLLGIYPAMPASVVFFASLCATIKWILALAVLLLIIGLGVVRLIVRPRAADEYSDQ